MSILITLVVYVLVFALLYWLITVLPFPPPLAIVKTILIILLVLVAVIALLKLVGVHV